MSVQQYSTKSAGVLWRLDVRTGGRTITRRGFKSKKEAKKAERAIREEADKGIDLSGARMELSEYLDFWLDYGNSKDWTPRHKARISNYMNHVKKNIGSVRLENLREYHVIKMRDAFREHWAERTIKQAEIQLKAALQDAVKNRLIAYSPIADLKTVSLRNANLKEAEVFEPHEQVKLLEGAKAYAKRTDNRWYMLVYLALGTGLRRGELLGLQWKHIDLENEYLTVRQSLNREGLKAPKSKAGIRTVYLGEQDCEELARYKLWTQEIYLKYRKKISKNDFLFFSDDLTEMNDNILRSRWDTIQKMSGLKVRNFHTLRHTHASAMISVGMDVKTLQDRLGHASPTITLGTYGHLFATRGKDENKVALNNWRKEQNLSRDDRRDDLLSKNHA
ncbi:MAG: hypothetical protein CL525_00355 [Aequorivita sp.]|nr:hypothetical protein [Aequorivita sp.]